MQASVVRLLKPLLRILLRHGVSYGVFADLAKRMYVELAMAEFQLPGRKATVSRAAVITGLSRKEVLRVSRLPALSDQSVQDRYNRAVRVISGWRNDPAYRDADDRPRRLALQGETGSFSALVRRYSGDVPVRAVLDELERTHVVSRPDEQSVALATDVYVPQDDEAAKLSIMGTEVSDLVTTIGHNLAHSGAESRLQLRVAYDNLPRESLAPLRTSAAERALALLQSLDGELSRLDRDVNPAAQGSGRMRAGVSIFYFEEALDEPPDNGEAQP